MALKPYLTDPDVTLYLGDALAVLRELPDESVHCIATSPPFYALRDYGVDGQIGLEETPDAWAAALVAVFRDARRVLRKHGTLWVECGDSYARSQDTNVPQTKNQRVSYPVHLTAGSSDGAVGRGDRPGSRAAAMGLKQKDLVGAPWLLAFALRADGWWLRGCNIWAKPNAMPESAKDRCTTAHSYVFQLSRSARYFFDGDAIAEPADWERWGDRTVTKHEGTKTSAGWIPPRKRGELVDVAARWDTYDPTPRMVKHPRSVWTIPTQGYPEAAHFATWPEALARRIILAGCPEGGTVLDPFAGSGTTCLVARKLNRRSIGIDLNPEYLDMAARRLQQQSLFAEAQ